jgi:uracil-DNA glycosylase
VESSPEHSATAARLAALTAEIGACRACAVHLPLGPRPVVRVSSSARVLITGQAPGTRVHATGVPWNDASGERLRGWLGLTRAQFYDTARVAIVPMGFCYPGRLANGGDAPPRRECAPLWRARLLAQMPELRLTLLVGSYAIAHTFGPGPMSGQVARFRALLPDRCALPHPSWRTIAWQRRNPWFAADLLPALRAVLHAELAR